MVHDNLGSPTAILDSSGSLVARLAWDAWGDSVDPATGTGTNPKASTIEGITTLGYTGHEMLWKQGLVHTLMRLYDPAIGRWLSPDPTVPNLYNGQALNRYSYVLNNPLSLTDPLGLSSISCTLTTVTITWYGTTTSFSFLSGCFNTGLVNTGIPNFSLDSVSGAGGGSSNNSNKKQKTPAARSSTDQL